MDTHLLVPFQKNVSFLFYIPDIEERSRKIHYTPMLLRIYCSQRDNFSKRPQHFYFLLLQLAYQENIEEYGALLPNAQVLEEICI